MLNNQKEDYYMDFFKKKLELKKEEYTQLIESTENNCIKFKGVEEQSKAEA